LNKTPAAKGNYLLQLHLEQDREIKIGARPGQLFRAGYYIYIGSAFGGGGLAARLNRHLQKKKRMHWHIDYLIAESSNISAWEIELLTSLEHAIAAYFLSAKIFAPAIPRFGSSDCSCRTHLFYTKRRCLLKHINKALFPLIGKYGQFTVYKQS
jgi:Uri superfamily endonuclease